MLGSSQVGGSSSSRSGPVPVLVPEEWGLGGESQASQSLPSQPVPGAPPQQREPSYKALTDGEVARLRELFSMKEGISTNALAELAKIPAKKVARAKGALANALITGTEEELRSLCAGSLRDAERWRNVLPLLGAKLRAWDETPSFVGIQTEPRPDADVVQSYWNIMHAIFTFLVLLEVPGGLEEVEHVVLLGHLPTFLLPLQRQTGEVLRAALKRMEDACDLDTLFSRFRHRVQISCADRAGANGRVSGHDHMTHAGWIELLVGCQAHDAHHCTEETLELRSRLLPRVAKACGSLTLGGLIYKLRLELVEFLKGGGLEFRRTDPNDAAAEAFRLAHIDLHWPLRHADNPRSKLRLRRLVMLRLPNGDWRRHGRIVHVCMGLGCCRDEAHCLAKFICYVVPAILPYAAPSVSQHRRTMYGLHASRRADAPSVTGWLTEGPVGMQSELRGVRGRGLVGATPNHGPGWCPAESRLRAAPRTGGARRGTGRGRTPHPAPARPAHSQIASRRADRSSEEKEKNAS